MNESDPAVLAKLDFLIEMVRGVDGRVRSLESEVAELKGEIRQMSVRISDVNARLPVPIAYQPPRPAAE